MVNFMVNFNGITSKVPFHEFFEFTVEEISQVFEYMGLMSTKETCHVEPMEKYIFLHGDEQEVYKKEERNFIESIGDIYIYREFHKKTKRGVMPCRVIAAEIDAIDEIKDVLFFMKEVNKAVGGFTIFFVKTGTDYYIGIRTFNKDVKDDCMISKPIYLYEDFEALAEKMIFVSPSEDFVEYYSTLFEALEYEKRALTDYDEQITKKRGVQYSYINLLSEISHIYDVDFSAEIERYYASFEDEKVDDYQTIVKEKSYELGFIESFKANTMEMLFEAEEMVQLAIKTEEEHNIFISNQSMVSSEENTESDDEMKEYLDDPEMMIKLLKQRKGI